MACLTTNTVDLVWDLTRERPTLGGALVLRQEGELLARLHASSMISLHALYDGDDPAAITRLTNIVFASSTCTFRLTREPAPEEAWPKMTERARPGFSYFSFSRLLEMHRTHGLVPRLQWSQRLQAQAQQARARFPGRLICLHLRSVAPYSPDESNADGAAWQSFLTAQAQAGVTEFLLLGDDDLPVGLTLGAGVMRATDLELDLPTQLALVGCADGFLGMASGLCTAANLSRVPHVIFKHPAHHPAEMARELGDADRFPFADARQHLWRRMATSETLGEAFALISR